MTDEDTIKLWLKEWKLSGYRTDSDPSMEYYSVHNEADSILYVRWVSICRLVGGEGYQVSSEVWEWRVYAELQDALDEADKRIRSWDG